jgi:hypothetical protein
MPFHLTPNPSPKREGNYTMLIINVLEYIMAFWLEKKAISCEARSPLSYKACFSLTGTGAGGEANY